MKFHLPSNARQCANESVNAPLRTVLTFVSANTFCTSRKVCFKRQACVRVDADSINYVTKYTNKKEAKCFYCDQSMFIGPILKPVTPE